MLCPCGQPLHYGCQETKEVVERLNAEHGELVTIRTNSGVYQVQRHYVALHGVKASEIPLLVAKGIINRVESGVAV